MKFGMFGRNVQVKIITASESYVLQEGINDWFKRHNNNIIIDIQVTESDNAYTASIFYQV